MDAFAVGAIIGVGAGVVGGLAVLVFALLQKPKACPECGTPAPKGYLFPNIGVDGEQAVRAWQITAAVD